MNTFQPDLIVEVTGACNRACEGCYAPNVVAKDAAAVFKKRPELFLKTLSLKKAISQIETFVGIVAVRGGEPSLHPKISALLKVAATRAEKVYLETHGRWLIAEEFFPYNGLLETIKKYKIIVKISYDKMHGLKPDELQRMTHLLRWHDVDYRIAITEATLTDYIVTRASCSGIEDSKIIYQPKAMSADELVKPTLGTINVRGELKKNLTHKFEEELLSGLAYA